jgi:hypothetical protein
MQYLNIALVTLFAIASATPVVTVKRSPATIQTELGIVDAQLHVFDNDIKHFTGGLAGIFQIIVLNADGTALVNDFTTLANDIVATGTLSAADSVNVAAGVATVVASLCTTLADAVVKAPVIATAGYTTLVHNGLVSAQAGIDDFFDSLELTIVAIERRKLPNR